jgi:hypothetical protein
LESDFNIILVESPLQLKNYLMIKDAGFIDAKAANCLVVRLNDNQACVSMLNKLVEENNISGSTYLFHSSAGNKFKLFLSVICLMFKLRLFFRGSCDLYLGDFRSKWMNFSSFLLRVNNTIYIDDGFTN